MRITFELTQQDLEEVQVLLAIARRERIHRWMERLREGPFWRHALLNAGLGVIVCFLLLPLAREPAGFDLCFMPGAVLAAIPIATAIQRRVGFLKPSYRRLYRWSGKRAGKRAASRSTLGMISIELTESGLRRENSTGTLSIPWNDVTHLVLGDAAFVARLRNRKVIVIPDRAFPDENARAAFVAQVVAGTGRPLENLRDLQR